MKLKDLFTPSKEKKDFKVYVGNGIITDATANISIDLTELAKYPTSFREIIYKGETHYTVDLTILPFKNGTNKFGNTHYIIIKNK